MIDSHAHIVCEFYDDVHNVIENEKTKMLAIINSADSIKSAEEIVNYSNKYKGFMYSTIGVHPQNVRDLNDLTKVENLINNKKFVAIGEIGLDYSHDGFDKELQKEFFIKQIEIANKYNLPIVVHSREATMDTYDILLKNKCRGVIHCFSGSLEMAKKYIELGFYLGIGGVLTFKNSNLYKVIDEISIDNILLETDSPFLTPHPYRGEINYPSNVKLVAEKIAEIKGISFDEVCKITSNNAIRVFDLDIKL